VNRRSSDSLVPVSVVEVDGSEVTNQVDNEEDSALTRLHSEITSLRVALNRMASRGGQKGIVHSAGASKDLVGRVGSKGEKEDDDQNHHSVYPVGDEGSLDTAKHGVCYDTDWKQETSSHRVHASEILDDGTAAG